MDCTKIECMSHACKGKHTIMNGAGASFGGRISYSNLKCPVCGLKIMIMPLSDKYEYSISATTEQERIEDKIKKAREESELELARTITRIRETGF